MERQATAHQQHNNTMSFPSIFSSLTADAISASESLSVMMEQERQCYFSNDYLPNELHCHDGDSSVTHSDRTKIVFWMYSVIDHCQFDPETVAVAMGLVDRFLSRGKDNKITKQAVKNWWKYQLTAVSALYIAIKINESVAFDSDAFSAMSPDNYTAEEIKEMEMIILKGVEWRVWGPTSLQMANYILSLVFSRLHEDELY